MAGITIRRSGELVRGIFKILLNHPDGLPAKDVLRQLEGVVPPTPFEQTTYPNRPNVRRYEKIVRFSTISVVKAGWLVKNKGLWYVTDEGRAAFTRFTNPENFAREANRLYRKWRADQSIGEDDENIKAAETAITIEEAEEAAWSEIETYLHGMSPYDFQELVAGLLHGMGYYVDWVSPPGRDGGLDIIAYTDPLGVKGPRIKVQVKRRIDKTTVEGIRGFIALLGESDVGLFVSAGGFTRDAGEEARRQEKRRLTLLDLKKLFDLWVEHYDRIPEEKRRLLPLRPVHYLAPDE